MKESFQIENCEIIEETFLQCFLKLSFVNEMHCLSTDEAPFALPINKNGPVTVKGHMRCKI